MDTDGLIQCYNRGCGQKYKADENSDDSCRHHPGEPFFHDAYKGWSCCNKKCTDFTEFLNTKGCTLSQHSNIKPPEPEKPISDSVYDTDIIEVKPIAKTSLVRPTFDTPMTLMKPEIAPSLMQLKQADATISLDNDKNKFINGIAVGTLCKNGGCKVSFEGIETDLTDCIYHPGYPVFHEGLKFWTCCTKRTSDFTAFLNQIGCEIGKHVWIKEENNSESVKCRWDHHQTGTHVIVSIYAKQYCWKNSVVNLSPVRLFTNVIFPQQNNAAFNLDLELRGIIDVDASTVNFFVTKVEIKLRKAEPGTWSDLNIPRKIVEAVKQVKIEQIQETLESRVDAVDLSDL